MKVMGIDPGTCEAGFGVIEADGSTLRCVASGTIRSPKTKPVAERLLAIHEGLARVIEDHRPDAVAIEDAFVGVNVQSALRIGEARAAAILAAAARGLEVAGYEPRLVKRAVAGRGGASKEQVAGMVRTVLGLEADPPSEHAADALAVAVCHAVRISEGSSGASGYVAESLKAAGYGKRRRMKDEGKAWADVLAKRNRKDRR